MSDVKAKLQHGAVVLDVRTADEFRAGAYPGALHIPISELRERLSEVPHGRPVVTYCAGGGRAGKAADLLRKHGWGDVTNAGGLKDMPR